MILVVVKKVGGGCFVGCEVNVKRK